MVRMVPAIQEIEAAAAYSQNHVVHAPLWISDAKETCGMVEQSDCHRIEPRTASGLEKEDHGKSCTPLCRPLLASVAMWALDF